MFCKKYDESILEVVAIKKQTSVVLIQEMHTGFTRNFHFKKFCVTIKSIVYFF